MLRNKFTLRYPSFRIVTSALFVFALIILVIFFIYKQKIFFFEFWIGFGGLMGIVLFPMIVITILMQYSVTFDSLNKKAIYRRWFYKREIPFTNLSLERQEEERVSYWLITSVICSILYFILGKPGRTLCRLYISDGTKIIQIADSIFPKEIERLENKINNYVYSV